MKILIVIDNLGSGGAQIQKARLAKGLLDFGNEVDFFTYKQEQFFKSIIESNNINIYSANKIDKGFSFRTLKRLRRIILSNDYDGIISSMHAPSIYAALAMFGIKSGKLIVCEESSSLAPVSILRKTFFYFACLKADSVVTNSFNETKLLGRWPGLLKKINTIWNGFEIPCHENNKNIVQNKVLKLLVVARISYPKNGLNLLRAILLFYKRNGWAPELKWAGRRDNDKRSIKMQKQMDQFLHEHPEISSNWRWLGEVENVNKLYRESDALILVSLYEGIANTISEAMIEECFVITSSVCDNEIVIGNEERGLLCNQLSPESICLAIERLNNLSFEQKNKIVKNARNYVEKNFNINKLTKSFISLLE
jgi:glycosyltransferase involved in cell wall biosynthesis